MAPWYLSRYGGYWTYLRRRETMTETTTPTMKEEKRRMGKGHCRSAGRNVRLWQKKTSPEANNSMGLLHSENERQLGVPMRRTSTACRASSAMPAIAALG